jgi:hypothetical protein
MDPPAKNPIHIVAEGLLEDARALARGYRAAGDSLYGILMVLAEKLKKLVYPPAREVEEERLVHIPGLRETLLIKIIERRLLFIGQGGRVDQDLVSTSSPS